MHVEIDPSFTAEQHAQIEHAADLWNAVANVPIVFGQGGGYIAREPPPPGFDGWTNAKAQRISIAPEADDVFLIAAHELGHAHGLHHIPDGAGVMSPVVSSDTLTRADLAECIRVRACD